MRTGMMRSAILSAVNALANNWLATARARVGYAADRVLFFGTAGGAFADMQTTYSGVQSSTTKAGWTAGAGVEWAFADNWTAKVEYLYIDLGTFNGNCSTAACVGATGAPGQFYRSARA